MGLIAAGSLQGGSRGERGAGDFTLSPSLKGNILSSVGMPRFLRMFVRRLCLAWTRPGDREGARVGTATMERLGGVDKPREGQGASERWMERQRPRHAVENRHLCLGLHSQPLHCLAAG